MVKEVEKKIPPDPTILIFLMKARMREKYGDRQKVEISGTLEQEKSKLDDMIEQLWGKK